MSTEVEEGIKERVDGVDNALIDSLIDAVHFDDLVLEKGVADVDQIEVFCAYYAKHADKVKFKDIRELCELQIFELICVCAWESVSKSGHLFKNDVKWGALVTHFDNILANYPLKQWWRVSLMQFLPLSKIPDGVIEIANDMCAVRWLFRRLGKVVTRASFRVVRNLKFEYYCTLVARLKKRQRRL